uniref:Uncharacterized protein n=1 Tax=Ulva partita TaxID=1605170 RepID=A0A1C9ZPS4_9CHLO|nr:hypothetical protein [Ulva partita]BAV58302.1 hypothetical protein [Ulva partita]
MHTSHQTWPSGEEKLMMNTPSVLLRSKSIFTITFDCLTMFYLASTSIGLLCVNICDESCALRLKFLTNRLPILACACLVCNQTGRITSLASPVNRCSSTLSFSFQESL